MRNKKLCLVIRIGDLREDNFILGTQISLKLLKRHVSSEGEITQEMQALKISPDKSCESCIFFVWPLEIIHEIDDQSPFYDLTATELPKQKFELVAVLEGTNETSNAKFQARTSYLPHEILWGHRFESMMLYRRDQKRFQVNFSAFHSTFEVTTPTISAKQLEKIMGGYVPPESRQMAELNSHLSNGTCLSPCHSLPSTLNRRKSALSAGKLLNGEDDDSDSIQGLAKGIFQTFPCDLINAPFQGPHVDRMVYGNPI